MIQAPRVLASHALLGSEVFNSEDRHFALEVYKYYGRTAYWEQEQTHVR